MVRARRRGDRRGPRLRGRGRASPTGRSSRGCARSAIAPRLRRLDPRAHGRAGAAAARARRPAAPPPGVDRRGRLFAAIAARAARPGAPLLLVADDLQWFDVPDAAVPALPPALARRTRRCWSPRRRAARSWTPATRWRAGRRAAGARAASRRSRSTGSAAPRRTCWPSGCSARRWTPAQADRLFAESEGNPLYLVEALQAGCADERARPGAGDDRGAARPAVRAGARAGGRGGDDRPRVLGRPCSPTRATLDDAGVRPRPRRAVAARHRPRARARPLRLQPRPHPRGRLRAARPRAAPRSTTCAWRGRSSARRGAIRRVLAAQYDGGGARSTTPCRWYRARRRGRAAAATTTPARCAALERALGLVAAAADAGASRELALLTALPAPLNALDGYRSERLDRVHAAGAGAGPPARRRARAAAAALAARSPRSPPATSTPRAPPASSCAPAASDGDDVLRRRGRRACSASPPTGAAQLEAARRHLEAAIGALPARAPRRAPRSATARTPS